MCFSAEASFTASGVLLIAGVASYAKASTTAQKTLAVTPVIFAIQQFTEGMLWLSFHNPEPDLYRQIYTYIFAIFGQIFWPIWVPITVLLFEQDPARIKVLKGLLGLGMVISAYLTYLTIRYDIRAEIVNHHIQYVFAYPDLIFANSNIVYLIPTVISQLVSSFRKVQVLGFIVLISFIITKLFYDSVVFSVWCFFAAIISVYIYYIIVSFNKPRPVA